VTALGCCPSCGLRTDIELAPIFRTRTPDVRWLRPFDHLEWSAVRAMRVWKTAGTARDSILRGDCTKRFMAARGGVSLVDGS
jgi:hypothetical protein